LDIAGLLLTGAGCEGVACSRSLRREAHLLVWVGKPTQLLHFLRGLKQLTLSFGWVKMS
jgi:hypothetical protein